ncbi:MAG: type IV pilus modification PilV family protein [Bdellovibrionales bacterium]
MKSQKGFALIQVIIAASILSVLALAVADLISSQRSAVSALEDQLEKIQLIRNIETVLKDGLSCQLSLENTTIGAAGVSTEVPFLKDNTGTTLYQSSTVSQNLLVGQITVTNDSVPGHSSSGFITLEVPIRRVRTGGGPQDLRPYRAKLAVTVDSSSRVTNCSNSQNSIVGHDLLTGPYLTPTTEKNSLIIVHAEIDPPSKNADITIRIAINNNGTNIGTINISTQGDSDAHPNKKFNSMKTYIIPAGSNVNITYTIQENTSTPAVPLPASFSSLKLSHIRI